MRYSGLLAVVLVLVSFAAAQDKLKAPKVEEPKLDKELAEIVGKLKSKELKVKLAAIEALAAMGEKAEPAAQYLCNAMMDSNVKVATASLEAIEKVKPELYKPLKMVCLDATAQVQVDGLRQLQVLGEAALPAFALLHLRFKTCLEKDNISDRDWLSLYVQDSRGIDLVQGSHKKISEFYNTALLAINPESTELHAALRWCASSKNYSNRGKANAIRELAKQYDGDKDKLKTLLPLLKSGLADSKMQIFSITTLGQLQGVSRDFLPTLKKLKLATAQDVREAAEKAVELIEQDK